MKVKITTGQLINILTLAREREHMNLGGSTIIIDKHGKITQDSKLDSLESLSFPFSVAVMNEQEV